MRKSHPRAVARAVALVVLGAIVVLAARSVAVAQSPAEFAGFWKTNYGPLQIIAIDGSSFVADYAYQGRPARLYARRVQKGIYEGNWVQQTSEATCSGNIMGSPFWGRFRFRMDGRSFEGLWNYCERRLVNEPDFVWTGRYDHGG